MKALKKIIDLFSSILLGVFILFVVLLVGVRLVGIEPYIVLSGSMEPEIKTGSLIYVEPLSKEEARGLEKGDTVTYRIGNTGTKVTHRIYEVVGPQFERDENGEFLLDENGERIPVLDNDGKQAVMYTTYGINNKNEQSPSGYTLDGAIGVGNLSSANVVGKPAVTVPYLGYIAHFVQNPPGKYITLAVCILLIFNTFFTSSSDKKSKEKEEENTKE